MNVKETMGLFEPFLHSPGVPEDEPTDMSAGLVTLKRPEHEQVAITLGQPNICFPSLKSYSISKRSSTLMPPTHSFNGVMPARFLRKIPRKCRCYVQVAYDLRPLVHPGHGLESFSDNRLSVYLFMCCVFLYR
jgi:hypothetical protein